MDKRYQVFVSSTYADLQEERQSVLQTLMEMDCIPAGMELFPAADEEQWEFIKRIIDDCDYYLLIIGGRYGSTAHDGLSYTEKEFDYAVSKGIKVIALLHKSPDDLPRSKSELEEENYQKLQNFREKVSDGRLVRFWNDASQLPGEVSLSLNKTMRLFPAVGWVRGDSAASPELLLEINELRKRNDELQIQLNETQDSQPLIPREELADWDSSIDISGTYSLYARRRGQNTQYCNWKNTVTWSEIFGAISPFLADKAFDSDVNRFIAEQFSKVDCNNVSLSALVIETQDLYTIRIQFLALGLIEIDNEHPQAQWYLTELGMQTMLKYRVVNKGV
ncbi:DUF4062 domain-containing protein [Alteromonas australica]|uniref:DUF4062 domain-containing protein n=1 Tax=Alteromonas australica TaxID=589873 RepID=A0A075NUJ2_9ALTE|nr:DUF4062 domain-containing protein [Alteromonas australica]AIF98279.1 hypothetical protein EP13_05955 [Alteromonas australica]